MPDYTGLWNAAAIAPDTGQAPGAAPILDLPADGEDADAASVTQAMRTLANHVAYLNRPTGIAAAWAVPTRSYRTARGHRMFEVDHHGLPGGHVVRAVEDFTNAEYFKLEGFGGGDEYVVFAPALLPGWKYIGLSTVVDALQPYIIKFFDPGNLAKDPSGANFAVPPWGRSVHLVAHQGITDRAIMIRFPTFAFHADLIGALEFDVNEVANHANGVVICGLVDVAATPLAVNQGLFFKADTGGTWTCVAAGAGGTSTPVVTAVNATSVNPRRMKIVWVGSGADDSSVSRALFFIDDLLVANITTTLPTNQAAMPFFAVQQETGAANVNLLLRGSIAVSYANLAA